MKILFVCSARIWGGDEHWTSLAMHHLSKTHQVFLYYRNQALADQFGKSIPKFIAPFHHIFDIVTYYRIMVFISRARIQVLIPIKRKDYFICGIISRLTGVKNILRLGIARNMKFPPWHWLIYNKLNDGIIVNSDRIRQNLTRYSFIDITKVRVIYNCLDETRMKTVKQWKEGIFTISSVGMLTRRNGFHLLLRGIANLPEKLRKELRLHIAGTGNMEVQLRLMTKELGLGEVVKFHGFLADPVTLVVMSDLFALLSSNEGIPNSILDAMTVGVPVLASYTSGAAEIIQDNDNGYLVDANHIPEITSALESIIFSRRDLPRIGVKGRKTVLEKFTREKMRMELEQFIISRLRATHARVP